MRLGVASAVLVDDDASASVDVVGATPRDFCIDAIV
jgi:hypothetical protein